MAGLSNPGMIKVKGEINEEAVIVLIDYGTTHNYISEKLVALLNLIMVETLNYEVILGFGAAIKGKRICEKV